MSENQSPADEYREDLRYEIATTHETGDTDGRGTMSHEDYMELLIAELKRVHE